MGAARVANQDEALAFTGNVEAGVAVLAREGFAGPLTTGAPFASTQKATTVTLETPKLILIVRETFGQHLDGNTAPNFSAWARQTSPVPPAPRPETIQ